MTSDRKLTLPALNPQSEPLTKGTPYPPPYNAGPSEIREKQVIGDALGLNRFGVNLVRMPEGAWSAMRHWHANEDEFVYIVEGEITLITNDGEQVLVPGDVAGFAAGREDGHHLVNNSGKPAVYLEVGSRQPVDRVDYPDEDLIQDKKDGERLFINRKGEPY